MGNQDKIYEQFKDAAGRAEEKGFDCMEAVWNRVEEKLDNNKQRRIATRWKYTGIAALFLLFMTVGFFTLNDNNAITAPETTPENNITVIDTQKVNEAFVPSKEIIKSAVVVNEATKQDINRQRGVSEQVSVSDTAHIITKEVTTVTIQPETLQKAKESVMADADTILSEVAIIDTSTNSIRSSAAVTSFSSSPLEDSSNADMIQSLQGQVAGLTIGSGSGQPGSDSTIVLRGVGTMNGNVAPLYVIDGIPVDEDGFRSIDQNDIESFQILKDAAATSIYGNRGANGVIIITTKAGLSKKELRKLKRENRRLEKQRKKAEHDSIKEVNVYD